MRGIKAGFWQSKWPAVRIVLRGEYRYMLYDRWLGPRKESRIKPVYGVHVLGVASGAVVFVLDHYGREARQWTGERLIGWVGCRARKCT